MKKRIILIIAAISMLLIAVSSFSGGQQEIVTPEKPVTAGFNWRQFEGETIYGLVPANPLVDTWFKMLIPKFEEETGIEVKLEVQGAGPARKKRDLILSGKDSSLDFFSLQMDNSGVKYTVAGHMEDLSPYLNDPTLTPPDFNYPDDWLGGCLNTAKVLEDQPTNNIVYSAQAQMLHYRSDLFEKYGVKVPDTLAEMEEAAKKLTIDEDKDGKPEIYGILGVGFGSFSTAFFGNILWNFGGSWIKDVNGKREANINSPESIDAFVYYGRLLRNYGPPGDNNPTAIANMFAAGQAAMLLHLNYWTPIFNNPEKSQIVGLGELRTVPTGPAGNFYNLPTRSLAVSSYSKKKKAAWLFLAWMTQRENMLFAQEQWAPMSRKSVWEDPAFKPPTPGWGESGRIALASGVSLSKPQTVAIGEMRSAIAEVVVIAVRDGSREAIKLEAEKQAAIMNELIAKYDKDLNFSSTFR